MGERETAENADASGLCGLLTTAEVERLTGITRWQLDTYMKKGIVTPLRAGASPLSDKRWTVQQVWQLWHVPTLLQQSFRLEDITALADQGTEATDVAMRPQYAHGIRAKRRALNNTIYRAQEAADHARIGAMGGDYLRHVPQRWLALAPAAGAAPGSAEGMAPLAGLLTVAHTAGWSITESVGALASLSAAGETGGLYAYVALATAPMPTPLLTDQPDSGCYRVFDPGGELPGCDGTRCEECARFGTEPSEGLRLTWREAEKGLDCQARTVMADALAEPYPTGTWAQYTACHLDMRRHERLRSHSTWPYQPNDCLTVRPRLMPHEVALPLGVTACELPAGAYLCHQCEQGDLARTYQYMLGKVSALARREFTEADELAAHRELLRLHRKELGGEDGTGPFAPLCTIKDPRPPQWHRPLGHGDLKQLTVPTRMALGGDDGCCIVCASLPTADRNEPARYEVQVLVNAGELAPPRQ